MSEIKVNFTGQEKPEQKETSPLPFGKIFADHMLVADYAQGQWNKGEIVPFRDFSISPANAALHYGQSIFEGIKAYKDQQGNPLIFRPDMNYTRFLLSAERMAMPPIPEDLFIGGMKSLVSLDRDWIPDQDGASLYIRPFMFATDRTLGVKASETYKFAIITSPTGPYFNKPIRLFVQDKYVRAFPGGTGFAKSAGNYGGSLFPTSEVKKQGYDQILWTDGLEHKYLQECGTMNLFVLIGHKAITPPLDQGTILAGVTRDSVIHLLRDHGMEVEERPLSIQEVLDARKKGELREVFGTGTAATIAYVEELSYNRENIRFDVSSWTIAPTLLKNLEDIHTGKTEDSRGWNLHI
ncbi:MAG TPA: branched-chain amino acid aminotransferase [Chitinophagaceae bacterium]|nr:branched-chain amino acid aminotransferase [Chitinophagaceae bacterium]